MFRITLKSGEVIEFHTITEVVVWLEGNSIQFKYSDDVFGYWEWKGGSMTRV